MNSQSSPDRARQFLPFAALTGFGGYIDREEERQACRFSDDPAGHCTRDFRRPDPHLDYCEDVDYGPCDDEGPAATYERFPHRDDSRAWDLRLQRILEHERNNGEEGSFYGQSDCEEECR